MKLVVSSFTAIAATAVIANTGDGIAAFNSGKGDVALRALRPLADAGDSVARCYVARIFDAASNGVLRDANLARQYGTLALPDLTTKATKGDASAQACLSWLRAGSYVGEPKLELSLQLATQAAAQGNVDGQWLLGNIYKRGTGIARNHEEANRWLEKASGSGNAYAKVSLALSLKESDAFVKDTPRAVQLFKELAESGYAGGQFQFANMLYSGTDTAKDLAWARYWYERAAEQHHPRAQNNLGWMCENGEGGVIDLSRAIAWYERSASQSSPDGLFNLGQALEKGKGVAKDVVQALTLYRKSAALGNKAAAAAIKRLTGKDAAATSNAEERVDSISDN